MPIITLIIVVVTISIILIAFSKLLGSKVWTVAINRWIVIGYLALGMISIIVLNITSKESEILSNEEREKLFNDETQLWNELLNGEVDSHYEGYLHKEWQMEITSDQFKVIPHLATDIKVDVLVERRHDPSSNVIYAITYVIPYQYRGFEFTEHASLDYFEFKDNNLLISQVPHQEFHFYEIKPRMEILAQFKEESEEDSYYSFTTGRTILFLNIPNHVNIIDESGYLYYVR